jgi:hypothetical protein
MGWGEPHGPAPAPTAATGTTGDVERAMVALAAVGVDGATLAEAAQNAARVIAAFDATIRPTTTFGFVP